MYYILIIMRVAEKFPVGSLTKSTLMWMMLRSGTGSYLIIGVVDIIHRRHRSNCFAPSRP